MPNQQDELYAAERGVPQGRRLKGLEDLESFVEGVRESNYWDRLFDDMVMIECACKRSPKDGSVGGLTGSDAWGRHGKIEMSPEHMTELFVCHEVAHVIAEARYGSRSHDPWFARTYLELVSQFVGTESYTQLHANFVRDNIDFNVTTLEG